MKDKDKGESESGGRSVLARAVSFAFSLLPFSLTNAGWRWLLIVAALLGVSTYKNINLLALLGYAMLGLLLVNALVVGRRLRRLQAQRYVDDMIFAGGRCKVEVRLRNLGARSRSGVLVEDVSPACRLTWYFDTIPGNARQRCRGDVVFPRRGRYEFGPVVASSGHPFGLVRRQVVIGPSTSVVVFPLLGKLSRERLRQQLRGADPCGDHVQRRGWRHDAAQADFHGLRPFRPGDSPRWIHWRTSARRGELMIREMEDVPGDDLVLILDTGLHEQHPAHLFEEAVSLAATIVQEWCQRRGDRLLLAISGTGEILDGVTGPEHARRLLECLAVCTSSPHAGPSGGPGSQLNALRLAAPLTAAVVVVSAGDCVLAPEVILGRPGIVLDVSDQREWRFYSSCHSPAPPQPFPPLQESGVRSQESGARSQEPDRDLGASTC